MKSLSLTILLVLSSLLVFAQDAELQAKIDSIEKTFTYEQGTIVLSNGVGKLNIPKGFKYLNPAQAERVLVDLWGNPPGENLTLGLILPESQGVLSSTGYVFNIQYDEIGYVSDSDADDIDYNEMLTQMQSEAKEANEERQKAGYSTIEIVGWAAKPFYDKEKKVLHWAKEIKFDGSEENTLNYNIRILGRKGVIVLNAIATMPNFSAVQKDIPKIANVVSFDKGFRYSDFDSSVDEVAAWTVGGLVAGKILTKTGFFAALLKFWKIIAVAVAALGGALWKRFTGKKDGEETVENTSNPA